MKGAGLMWTALIILIGVGLFVLKYQVQGLEDQLNAKQAQVERAQTAIRVLDAEWAYLNDPERLSRLSAEYLQFRAPTQANFASFADLPMRDGKSSPENTEAPASPFAVDQNVIVAVERPASETDDRSAPAAANQTVSNPVAGRAAQTAFAADQRSFSFVALANRVQRIFASVGPSASVSPEARP